MTAQPEHHAEELIPRPERTITALKAALAVVASDRLLEMQAEQAEAITMAIDSDTLDPLRGFLLRWAVIVEIERHPEIALKLRRAEYLMQVEEEPEDSRRHALTAAEIIRAAYRALGA
ncbi:hypothetical protein [Streptacidiphilus albus]|uniref:hypothetical protein n=1 Tax=Streptacidiphilus albus TaxID=105425 RepID=UPI00054B2E2C|nr:hypothetical protein [Streptacidiphilus albus]